MSDHRQKCAFMGTHNSARYPLALATCDPTTAGRWPNMFPKFQSHKQYIISVHRKTGGNCIILVININ